MSEEDKIDLLNKHDKHIDMMAQSIQNLAGTVGSTNRKLDDIITVIGKQNVLMEKFSNMEANLKESFTRVHVKIKDLENTQNGIGCHKALLVDEKLSVANKRIQDIEGSVRWVIRTIGATILLAITSLLLHKGP